MNGDSSGNIVVFRPQSDYPLERRKKSSECLCSCIGDKWSHGERSPKMWIDEATRMVECQKCGSQMEAFDYLWFVSTKAHHIFTQITRLNEDLTSLKAQRTVLEEELKTLRAERNKLKRVATPAKRFL